MKPESRIGEKSIYTVMILIYSLVITLSFLAIGLTSNPTKTGALHSSTRLGDKVTTLVN